MLKIEQAEAIKGCLTCVHRRPYPGSVRNDETIYSRFRCGMAPDTGRELVRPEEQCDLWAGASLNVD